MNFADYLPFMGLGLGLIVVTALMVYPLRLFIDLFRFTT